MLRLMALAISIGIADSLNPTTIGPALYLAAGKNARGRVAEFTAAVFVVYLVGGAAIALGPGQLLLSAVPHPSRHTRYVLEIIAGVAMLTAAAFLWGHRKALGQREAPTIKAEGKSSAILGATITAIELPTAFPYFAVIAAIVGSGLDPARQLGLLLLFNICFVAPLLGIVAVLTFAGDRAGQLLTRARSWLEAHWPVLLAGLACLAGVFVVLLGVTGLAGTHSRLGRIVRPFRQLIQPLTPGPLPPHPFHP
jgi:cytochrome c biogenesis protein CcdA